MAKKSAEIQLIGRVSNKSVLKCTGRPWRAWIQLLNGVGAQHWPHREIVLYLKKEHKLTPWW